MFANRKKYVIANKNPTAGAKNEVLCAPLVTKSTADTTLKKNIIQPQIKFNTAVAFLSNPITPANPLFIKTSPT